MARLIRSRQLIPQVWPPCVRLCGVWRRFASPIDAPRDRRSLPHQGLGLNARPGLMTTKRYIPQGLRSTLR